ncbi:hypothetical protein AZE42_09847 [Rhizopogon vesiculosus]|uniref:Uncharacterized protein n=1 Tax=Rhizopogon vesiculosus TaxID=180088 RepID=A0A1J8QY70_9AGAM|nr:hypothetical protein AZE42_09847 [Rhizopogon vesiculosus]
MPASVSAQRTIKRRTSASSSSIKRREPSSGPLHGPRQRVFMRRIDCCRVVKTKSNWQW